MMAGLPYAVNLIHSPFDASLERGNVELFLRRGVRVVEASAFMNLTEHVVRYRVAGLERDPATGAVVARNKVRALLVFIGLFWWWWWWW